MVYCISDTGWADRYDARIDLDGGDILLHSRGGATVGRPPRNTEYEKALRTIVRRLRSGGLPDSNPVAGILLDSAPARRRPEGERLLADAAEVAELPDEQLIRLVRERARTWGQKPGTKGGNSTKALRIRTQGRSPTSLRSTLQLMSWPEAEHQRRLSSAEQRRVAPSHIYSAVSRLLSGAEAPNFAESRDYDVLLPGGERLPPKKVFGLALEEALGIQILPAHFSAGWGQPCFELIQDAGFRIVEKNNAAPTVRDVQEALESLPPDDADQSALEGSLRLVVHFQRERAAGLARRKKAAFIREHGHLFCERCRLDPADAYGSEIGDACIEVHHARTQVKDMEEGHQTELEDLECLCANCHRVIHREMALGVAKGTV